MTYPPQQGPEDWSQQPGGYPPQQGGYPPQQGGYGPPSGYPPPPGGYGPPPKSKTGMIVGVIIAVTVVLGLGALGVTGFVAPGFLLSDDDSEVDPTSTTVPRQQGEEGNEGGDDAEPTTAEPQPGEDTDVFALAVGDCFDDVNFEDEEIESVPIVPCDQAHDNEVYSETDSDSSGDFPGDDAIAAEADEYCFAEFEGFVGVSYDSSALEFWYLYPTSLSWDDGDRLLQCVIYDPDGQVSGSLGGAAR